MSDKTLDILIDQAARMEGKIDKLHEMIHEDRQKRAAWHGRYLALVTGMGLIGGAFWDFLKRKFLG